MRGVRRGLSVVLAGLLLFAPAFARAAETGPAPAEIDAPCPDEPTPASPPDVSDPYSLAGAGTMALKDAIYVLDSPVRWDGTDWVIVGGAALGVIALSAFADAAVQKSTQSHQTQFLDDLTKVVEPFGAQYSWAVIGAYALVGFAFHDTNARDIAFDSIIASVLASGIITPSMKFMVGRARPNQDLGVLSFHPFQSGYTSFPSGHTTQAFAVASVISAHSDELWVSAAAYTLASLVAFARIYHNAHWTSDTAAGALIGMAVGRGVVSLNNRFRKGESRVKIVFAPIAAEHGQGAGVTVIF